MNTKNAKEIARELFPTVSDKSLVVYASNLNSFLKFLDANPGSDMTAYQNYLETVKKDKNASIKLRVAKAYVSEYGYPCSEEPEKKEIKIRTPEKEVHEIVPFKVSKTEKVLGKMLVTNLNGLFAIITVPGAMRIRPYAPNEPATHIWMAKDGGVMASKILADAGMKEGDAIKVFLDGDSLYYYAEQYFPEDTDHASVFRELDWSNPTVADTINNVEGPDKTVVALIERAEEKCFRHNLKLELDVEKAPSRLSTREVPVLWNKANIPSLDGNVLVTYRQDGDRFWEEIRPAEDVDGSFIPFENIAISGTMPDEVWDGLTFVTDTRMKKIQLHPCFNKKATAGVCTTTVALDLPMWYYKKVVILEGKRKKCAVCGDIIRSTDLHLDLEVCSKCAG